MRTFIVFLLCMAAGALILGVLQMTHTISVIGQEKCVPDGDWDPNTMPLPTIQQIQRAIGCEKVDGKVCCGWANPGHSETQTKWDKAICDKFARRHFKETNND